MYISLKSNGTIRQNFNFSLSLRNLELRYTKNMNLSDLYTFSIVAKLQTITAAAVFLNVPKSTVSRRIKRLEENLEVELFQRSPKKIILTQDGKGFYEHISNSLDTLIVAQNMLKDRSEEPSGRLRITTTEGYGQSLSVLKCLASYTQKYPKVQIDLILTSRVTSLVEEQIDIGLRLYTETLPGDANTMSRRLHHIASGIYASREYLERRGTPQSIDELIEHDFVAFSQVSFSQKPWLYNGEHLRERLSFAEPRILVNNTAVLVNCALVGAGLCILDIGNAQPLVDKGELVRILPQYEQQIAKVSVVWVSSKHLSRKVRTFIDHAVEFLR